MSILPKVERVLRFSEEKAASIIEAAGFKITKVKEAGPYHYIFIAKP